MQNLKKKKKAMFKITWKVKAKDGEKLSNVHPHLQLCTVTEKKKRKNTHSRCKVDLHFYSIKVLNMNCGPRMKAEVIQVVELRAKKGFAS